MGRPWFENGLQTEDPDHDNAFYLRKARRERVLRRRQLRESAKSCTEAPEADPKIKEKSSIENTKRRFSFSKAFEVSFSKQKPTNSGPKAEEKARKRTLRKRARRPGPAKQSFQEGDVHQGKFLESESKRDFAISSNKVVEKKNNASSVPEVEILPRKGESFASVQSLENALPPNHLGNSTRPNTSSEEQLLAVERSISQAEIGLERTKSRAEIEVERTHSRVGLNVDRENGAADVDTGRRAGRTTILRRIFSRNHENMRSGFNLTYSNVDGEERVPAKWMPAYFEYQQRRLRTIKPRRRKYRWVKRFYGRYQRRNSVTDDVQTILSTA